MKTLSVSMAIMNLLVASFQRMRAVAAWNHVPSGRRVFRPPLMSQTQSINLRSFSQIFMTTTGNDIGADSGKTIESSWKVPGLKKEVQRLLLRCHKKVGKANQRLKVAQERVEELSTNPSASLEALEQCPDVSALEEELAELQERLQRLNELESELASINKKNAVLPEHVATLALQMHINDEPPARQPRGVKKKGPRTSVSTRKPYRRYYSTKNVEIRVGKQAEDNDQLTLSRELRDDLDWWMHASGCPGSHVVIRCTDESLDEDVVMDAAALAARQSKCAGSHIKVSMTRCRDIIKPSGAKAGLVQLTGKVRTIAVNMKEAQARLDRLDATVLVN